MTLESSVHLTTSLPARIITITLNAAIDKTYYLEAWSNGEIMRVDNFLSMAGGKGINVARVLSQLGHADVMATGFMAGYNGQYIVNDLLEKGIPADFVEIPGESRLCLNFMNQNDSTSTEIIEPGPTVQQSHEASMKDKIRLLADRAQLIIISGSVPKGCRAELYKELIEIAHTAGAKVFLDASRQPLLEGMKAAPHLIKPNEAEILPWICPSELDHNGVIDVSSLSEERIKKIYGQALFKLSSECNVPKVIVTLGSRGALAYINHKLYRINTPAVKIVNPVGSGDAFVAGYAYAYARQWPVNQCLRYAAACGTANAMNSAAGFIKMEDMDYLLEEVIIEEWDEETKNE